MEFQFGKLLAARSKKAKTTYFPEQSAISSLWLSFTFPVGSGRYSPPKTPASAPRFNMTFFQYNTSNYILLSIIFIVVYYFICITCVYIDNYFISIYLETPDNNVRFFLCQLNIGPMSFSSNLLEEGSDVSSCFSIWRLVTE